MPAPTTVSTAARTVALTSSISIPRWMATKFGASPSIRKIRIRCLPGLRRRHSFARGTVACPGRSSPGIFSTGCVNVTTRRVTALVVDPSDHKFVWAGVEVDGVRVSQDGGDTWTRPSGGLLDAPDLHDIKPLPGKSGAALVTLPEEICVSTDGGMNWQGLGVRSKFPLPYCRSITFKPDDMRVILAAIG